MIHDNVDTYNEGMEILLNLIGKKSIWSEMEDLKPVNFLEMVKELGTEDREFKVTRKS